MTSLLLLLLSCLGLAWCQDCSKVLVDSRGDQDTSWWNVHEGRHWCNPRTEGIMILRDKADNTHACSYELKETNRSNYSAGIDCEAQAYTAQRRSLSEAKAEALCVMKQRYWRNEGGTTHRFRAIADGRPLQPDDFSAVHDCQ